MSNRKINFVVLPIIIVVRIYQIFISPLFPRSCRFFPTCSSYSIEAMHRCGLIKGLKMTFHRIIRCHPGNPGGYDPVP